MAAAPVVRFPVFGLVRLLGLAASAAILVWAVHFRGGMALSSEKDKLLIFNLVEDGIGDHALSTFSADRPLPKYPQMEAERFPTRFDDGAMDSHATDGDEGPLATGATTKAKGKRVVPSTAPAAGGAKKARRVRPAHPVLMLIGFVVLNGEAILAYKTVSGTKKLKKLVHLSLQFIAMILSIVGLWAVWKFHNEKAIDHLYTLHSWLGLSCIILFSIQWAAGFWTFWYPGGSRSGRASLLPWHVFFGVFLYVLAIATSVSGLLEKSIFMQSAKMIGRFSMEAMLMNLLGMLLVLLGALVILAAISPGAGKIDTYRGSSE